mgnify:FL=1
MNIHLLENGNYQVAVSENEKDLISIISAEVNSFIQRRGGEASRLFPSAYIDQPEAENEYQTMIHDDLVSAHTSALETLTKSLAKPEVMENDLVEMMRALNILRLFLGERLSISEDYEDSPSETDPSYDIWILFQIFGQMLSSIIDVLQEKI